jgi:hypothetical protein
MLIAALVIEIGRLSKFRTKNVGNIIFFFISKQLKEDFSKDVLVYLFHVTFFTAFLLHTFDWYWMTKAPHPPPPRQDADGLKNV